MPHDKIPALALIAGMAFPPRLTENWQTEWLAFVHNSPGGAGAIHPVHENPELALIAGMAFPPRLTENAIAHDHIQGPVYASVSPRQLRTSSQSEGTLCAT